MTTHVASGRLIGIHFRAGDQMPKNWRDPPRHALSEVEEFLACAETMEKTLGWSAHFLLFADTDKVLENPRVQELQQSGKLTWPAQDDGIIHLDRSPATLTVRGLLGVWAPCTITNKMVEDGGGFCRASGTIANNIFQ